MSPATRPSGRDLLLATGAIVLVWAAIIGLVGLGGDYPLNDDWAYAASARGLLHTGKIRILEWAAPSLVTHVVFGAALMRLFGESYVVLRCGTLAVALLGLFALYGLSRRAGLSPGRAALPSLALAVAPWFVNLSFTYMSDVPWLSLMLFALYVGACALRPSAPPRPLLLLVVGVLLGLAALIRQFAVVTAPAFLLAVALDARRRRGGWPQGRREAIVGWAFVMVPLVLIYGAFHYWYTRIHGPTMANRDTWRQMAGMNPRILIQHMFAVVFYIGLWLLPLAVAVRRPFALRLGRRLAAPLAVAMAGFAMVAAVRSLFAVPSAWRPGETMKPMMPYLGNIFYVLGLGPPTLYEAYIGQEALVHPDYWFSALLTGVSIVGAVLIGGLFGEAVQGVVATVRKVRRDVEDDPERALHAEVRVLVAGAGLMYLGWHLLTGTFLFDRYLLPLLPLCWLLVLGALPDSSLPLRRAPLVALLVGGLLVSAAGTHEYLAWNAARERAVKDLLRDGVTTDQIDAGFEWNGTWRFESYVKKYGTVHMPDRSWWSDYLPYRLSFQPNPRCQIYRRYPYWTWPGGGSPAILVLTCPTTPPERIVR